jgi:hypothetical protein
MHFVVNGRDDSSSLDITGYRCLVDCSAFIDPVEETE